MVANSLSSLDSFSISSFLPTDIAFLVESVVSNNALVHVECPQYDVHSSIVHVEDLAVRRRNRLDTGSIATLGNQHLD